MKELLKNINEIDYNCFIIEELSGGQALSYLMIHIFQINGLFDKLRIDFSVFSSFVLRIQNGYKDNPYHNKLHAFDVVQTTNFFLKKCNFISLANLNDIEVAAMYIAAMIHDYEHPFPFS